MSTVTESDESKTTDHATGTLATADGDASYVESADGHEAVPTTARLGTEQWVIFAFAIASLIVFWVSKNVIVTIWDRFAEPDTTIATLAALVLAVGGSFLVYRKPNVHAFATDVALEYEQVSWPTRDEAWSHTVVVIVVSIVSSLILAVYDMGWSSLMDFLYRV